MKLTKKQREALQWLDGHGPWTTPWWGGRPFTRWPKELPARTFDALSAANLVAIKPRKWADQSVVITEAGRQAIAA